MKTNTSITISKKDFVFGVLAGLLMGILMLPILNAAKPELFEKIKLILIPFFVIATPVGLYIASIISKKIAVIWQLAKFIVTGGLNFLVDLGVLSLLIFVFKNYFQLESNAIIFSFLTFYSLYKATSFIVANINSYYWNKYWTFHAEGGKKSEFVQFFIVSLVGFVINVFFASVLFKYVTPFGGLNFDQWGLMGAVVGSIAGIAWNFVGYKFIVFKK